MSQVRARDVARNPGVKRLADMLEAGVENRRISREDLRLLADCLSRMGEKVDLPDAPADAVGRGWTTTRKRKRAGGRVDTYRVFCWRDEKGMVHERSLGPMGRARLIARPLHRPLPPEALPIVGDVDPRLRGVLHDD